MRLEVERRRRVELDIFTSSLPSNRIIPFPSDIYAASIYTDAKIY
jgi:hypothetical protein